MKSKEEQYIEQINEIFKEDYKIIEPSDYERVFVHNPASDWGMHSFYREMKIIPFSITVEYENNPVVGDVVDARNCVVAGKDEINEMLVDAELENSKKIYVIKSPFKKLNRFPFVKKKNYIIFDEKYSLSTYGEQVLLEVGESVYRKYGKEVVNIAIVEHSYKSEVPKGSLNTFDKLVDLL